jgi:hypothetical protein
MHDHAAGYGAAGLPAALRWTIHRYGRRRGDGTQVTIV